MTDLDSLQPGWYIVQVLRGQSATIQNVWPVDGDGGITDTLAMPALAELFSALTDEGPPDAWEPVDTVRAHLDEMVKGGEKKG